MTFPDKKRWPHAIALTVASSIVEMLEPHCERIIIAGSVRRQKPSCGDVEILYIPKIEDAPDTMDMFRRIDLNLADQTILAMERAGILARRKNSKGSEMFGAKNKLMVHVETGIPVDLFTATEENWFNYLTCRTGPSESNIRICETAIKQGKKWHPYDVGFEKDGEMIRMNSEQEVFEFVGLPYKQPEDRT